MLVWKTNFHNPYVNPERTRRESIDESSFDNALRNDKAFYGSMIKGPPKATDTYTVEQLEDMGMVGLYREEQVEMEP